MKKKAIEELTETSMYRGLCDLLFGNLKRNSNHNLVPYVWCAWGQNNHDLIPVKNLAEEVTQELGGYFQNH